MARIQICDLCKKEILNAPGRWGYKLSHLGTKMDICTQCMNKFCEWAGLPLQYKEPRPPKCNGNIAQDR